MYDDSTNHLPVSELTQGVGDTTQIHLTIDDGPDVSGAQPAHQLVVDAAKHLVVGVAAAIRPHVHPHHRVVAQEDPVGLDGLGLQEARKITGRPAMISLTVLYGLGGVLAALLFAYLIYALIRAEEF